MNTILGFMGTVFKRSNILYYTIGAIVSSYLAYSSYTAFVSFPDYKEKQEEKLTLCNKRYKDTKDVLTYSVESRRELAMTCYNNSTIDMSTISSIFELLNNERNKHEIFDYNSTSGFFSYDTNSL